MRYRLVFTLGLVFTASELNAGPNAMHDQMMALNEATRARALGAAVDAPRSPCIGRRSAYKGMDQRSVAFWRVDCTNGHSYLIGIEPDRQGNTKSVDCSMSRMLERLAGQRGKKDLCFDDW
jgi:hypothetical protein